MHIPVLSPLRVGTGPMLTSTLPNALPGRGLAGAPAAPFETGGGEADVRQEEEGYLGLNYR